MVSDADKKLAAEVAAARAKSDAQRKHPTDGGWMISGQEAADIACQNAFRLAKGNGAKMRDILLAEYNNSIFARPSAGGAFAVTGNECHPNLPGVNMYMAKWIDAYLDALVHHINQIKI